MERFAKLWLMFLWIRSGMMILVIWIFRVFIWIGWIPWMVWISRKGSWYFILLLSSIDPIFILAHPCSFQIFSTQILDFKFATFCSWKITLTWWCRSINWSLNRAILWWYYGRKLRIATLNHHRINEMLTLWSCNYLEIRVSTYWLCHSMDW